MDGGESYSLSDDDIQKILGGTKILRYPDFANMSSINEAFDPKGRCVFLYLTQDSNTGHWISMWKQGDRINYFNSYGIMPDGERWLSEEKKEELGEDEPYLTRLLRASGCKVYANTYSFQAKGGDVSTCGRWASVRLLMKDKSDREFYNIVKQSGMPGDEFVTHVTREILGK